LDEALRAAVFWAEQAEKPEAGSGKITLVFVRQGATAANGDLTLARAVAPLLANNFPERLDKVLVYPTGPGFRAAWMAGQLFLDAATRKKVREWCTNSARLRVCVWQRRSRKREGSAPFWGSYLSLFEPRYPLICEYILTNHCTQFTGGGDLGPVRTVEPHCAGAAAAGVWRFGPV
jgi:hypothetical protein